MILNILFSIFSSLQRGLLIEFLQSFVIFVPSTTHAYYIIDTLYCPFFPVIVWPRFMRNLLVKILVNNNYFFDPSSSSFDCLTCSMKKLTSLSGIMSIFYNRSYFLFGNDRNKPWKTESTIFYGKLDQLLYWMFVGVLL